MIKKIIIKILDHFEEIVATSLFFIIFLLIAYTIIGRWMRLPTSSAYEAIQYAFIITVLFGISYAAKKKEHIRAEIILEHVPKKVKKAMLICSDILWFLFSASIVWLSFSFIKHMVVFDQKTPILHIPYWILYSMVPLSAGITCIRIIQTSFIKIFTDR